MPFELMKGNALFLDSKGHLYTSSCGAYFHLKNINFIESRLKETKHNIVSDNPQNTQREDYLLRGKNSECLTLHYKLFNTNLNFVKDKIVSHIEVLFISLRSICFYFPPTD